MPYFPMFVDLKDKKCLVIGGGKVAYRKIVHMQCFEAKVTVVAQDIIQEIKSLEDVLVIKRNFEESKLQLTDFDMVISVTNDRAFNHAISEQCQEFKIPVNVVDCPSECSFIFPAYIKKGDVVAAFSSGGNAPVLAQYLKKENETTVTDWLGEVADFMGSKRDFVKKNVSDEKDRKRIYQRMLEVGIQEKRLLSDSEILELIPPKSC